MEQEFNFSNINETTLCENLLTSKLLMQRGFLKDATELSVAGILNIFNILTQEIEYSKSFEEIINIYFEKIEALGIDGEIFKNIVFQAEKYSTCNVHSILRHSPAFNTTIFFIKGFEVCLEFLKSIKIPAPV